MLHGTVRAGELQSPERRSRTARKGLALARNITNHRLLAAAVREIAPILPPDAAETALGLLELVWNPDWTVPAVEALAPRLADEQLRRALSAALPEGFGMDSWVIARLPVLLSRLAAAGHLETLGHALDEQLKLFTRPDSMRALLNLLPLLTSGQVQEAWDRLIAENNLRDRAEALAVLVPHLPHAERAAAVPLALAAMNDPGSSGPSDMDELKAGPGHSGICSGRAPTKLARSSGRCAHSCGSCQRAASPCTSYLRNRCYIAAGCYR